MINAMTILKPDQIANYQASSPPTNNNGLQEVMFFGQQGMVTQTNQWMPNGQPINYQTNCPPINNNGLREIMFFMPMKIFIPVDKWVPAEEDKIIKQVKGALILPISKYYNITDDGDLDYFYLTSKRCYNSDKIREHFVQYLNYFEKFYDTDKELTSIWMQIKYLIDYEGERYDRSAFVSDIKKYILGGMILYNVRRMNIDNYNLNLTASYTNTKNPELQYNDKHGMILMEISLLQNMVIPLITHFAYKKKIINIKDLLMQVFTMIFELYDQVDIYSKLYETAKSNIDKNKENHPVLWHMQGIRGENNTTHASNVVDNIILQIIPKYRYDENLIYYNYGSISTHIEYQVIGIGYEYTFISLSSSKRDEDNNSEMDKFESHLSKTDMALYMQNEVNCQSAMKRIEEKYGPYSEDEIQFYIRELSTDGRFIINDFQKNLIFNLFYKEFGDSVAIKGINQRDYIKLLISAKRILMSYGMRMLPAIISSKVIRIVPRKNINKKEMIRLEASDLYEKVRDKYRNPKIEKDILALIAQIISSDFQIIDYDIPEINRRIIEVMPEIICDEVLMFVLLI